MIGGRRMLGAVAAGAAALVVSGCVSAPTTSTGPVPARSHHRDRETRTPTPSQAAVGGPRPKGPVSRGWRVYDVVDGDTVKVQRGRRQLTLRLIGIDTPETVDPGEPVQCFGPESSAFAQRRLAGRRVLLERDPSQGRLDYYGRTLAYVWVVRPTRSLWPYDLAAVRRGYAFEYTYDQPYLWQAELRRAQAAAQAHRRGLWSPRTCDGDPYHGL